MKTTPVTHTDRAGVMAVPPLARPHGPLDWEESARIVRHLQEAGITRLLYGGNAFLYHLTLAEYEGLLGWLNGLSDDLWCIASAGPSYGRLMDQAPLLRRHRFPAVMHLPCGDPRDAAGLERGLRDFVHASGTPLIVYLKDHANFGPDREAGLDVVARLVADGLCVGIKYAVVLDDPADDPYLEALLARVDRSFVISGIGERPAVTHLRRFGLPGYTTGSGCVGAGPTQALFAACQRGDWDAATAIRAAFLPLEDARDAWGPARVLHAAVAAAGIARTGDIPPFVSPLDAAQVAALPRAIAPLLALGSPREAEPLVVEVGSAAR